MILDVNMFRTLVKLEILVECNDALIVDSDLSRNLIDVIEFE